MDRKTLKLPFTLNRSPDWVCPTCAKGVLRIKTESFFKEERHHSRDHSHEAWEPEWIEYVYSCLLMCTNDQCKEVVSSTGVGSVDWGVSEDGQGEFKAYEDFFRPKFFEPHLMLFSIPDECPPSISNPLHDSFRVFFSVPSAASNNVRIAIEELLTELKIKRYTTSKGRRRFINLHERISLLPDKYAEFKEVILAIKWLGNAGSHGNGAGKDTISMDDVLDSYEFIQHILNEIHAPKAKKILAIARRVNKRKGPVKPRVRPKQR